MSSKQIKHEVPGSPYEAFRLVVYRYGTAALADLMGLKKGSLYNKADADAESLAQPTLRDVVAVTRLTGDTLVLESLDRMFDRAAIDIRPGPVSDEALLDLLCRVGSENGQMQQALRQGYADNRFCKDDYALVRGEAYDLISAVLAFLRRMEGLVDD